METSKNAISAKLWQRTLSSYKAKLVLPSQPIPLIYLGSRECQIDSLAHKVNFANSSLYLASQILLLSGHKVAFRLIRVIEVFGMANMYIELDIIDTISKKNSAQRNGINKA